MSDQSLMIEVLQGIRSDIQQTNARLDTLGKDLNERLDQTNARLDQTNARLDQTNARLDRVAEGQIRMGTQLNERLVKVEEAVVGLNSRIDHILTGPVGNSIRDLQERVRALEQRNAS